MIGNPLILLFLKGPVPGLVKTRLAKNVGDEKACAIYNEFLHEISSSLQKTNWRKRILFRGEKAVLQKVFSGDFDFSPQSGMDLGERMENGFRHAFSQGYSPVLALGGDCPDLPPEYLVQAFEKLKSHDLVLGPAQDGGYYLIAMNSLHKEIFQGIDWSTEIVLKQTRSCADKLGLRSHLLPPWFDVDTVEDYRSYLERTGKNPDHSS